MIGCATPTLLDSSEVREYNGERLDSISKSRENSIKGPQYIDISSYRLKVDGLVQEPQELVYEDVLAMPKYEKVVTLYCVEEWNAKILWEGVLVRDLIDKADPLPWADTVIFHAYDGYTTSLPLQYLIANDILLAYRMNSETLRPEHGFPFQLVAEDKWGYKWIKWMTRIELSDDSEYRGYWEEVGYSNDANLDKPSR